jgi:hypothetical protein
MTGVSGTDTIFRPLPIPPNFCSCALATKIDGFAPVLPKGDDPKGDD